MISDTLVQLQGFVKQNHLHSRTQTRKMVGLAAQQKDTQAVDWFFAQFANPPYPEFSKNFLNEDLLRIVVNSQWEYAWVKITEVVCTQKTNVSLRHLLDIASPNPQAMRHILPAAIAALPHCSDPDLQKELASTVAQTAVRQNLSDVYHAVVKYASADVLYKKTFYWDSLVETASSAGSLWLMDVLVENQAPSKLIGQLLHNCAPLYSIEKVENMYNSAKGVVDDHNALNSQLVISLAQRFVEPQTALFLQKLMDQIPLNDGLCANRSVLRWCTSAISSTPSETYKKVVDAITDASDLVGPLQTIFQNTDGFEAFVPLLTYWSNHHPQKFTDAIGAVMLSNLAPAPKVAKKLIGSFNDAVDKAVVNNWPFNNCEEVTRVRLKWNLEEATAQCSSRVSKKKM